MRARHGRDARATHGRDGHATYTHAARRGGQILVITMLAMTLLAGLVFYVYNTGYHVNRRMKLQQSADATAMGGAVWVARSMNVVAMNNVAQAKLIAAVPVLDSLPLATRMALDEVTALKAGLDDQIAMPLPGAPALSAGLVNLRDRMRTQMDVLAEVDQVTSGSTIPNATHWTTADGGMGSLWEAAVTLDELSRATVASSGVLAQENASRWGKLNGAETAFIVPVLPGIPAKSGTFRDFEPPLRGYQKAIFQDAPKSGGGTWNASADMLPRSGLGGAIPDFQAFHRMGPWARLLVDSDRVGGPAKRRLPDESASTPPVHGYRYPLQHGGGSLSGPAWTSNLPGVGGYGSSVPRQGQSLPGASTPSVVVGYYTYGPYHWHQRHVTNWSSRFLGDTTFTDRFMQISNIKIEYMFGDPNTVRIHYPLWNTQYPQARPAYMSGTGITATKYYFVESFQGLPGNGNNSNNPIDATFGGFVMPDTIGWVNDPNLPPRPNSVRDIFESQIDGLANGLGARLLGMYVDQIKQAAMDRDVRGSYSVVKTGGGTTSVKWRIIFTIDGKVYKDEQVYEMRYSVIGSYAWRIVTDTPYGQESGGRFTPVTGTYEFAFGGIDIGSDVPVENPCNWPPGTLLPAPVLVDSSLLGKNIVKPVVAPGAPPAADQYALAFLGAARTSTVSPAWPSQFSGANPTDKMAALAQAKVFNNSSIDLWTQDWRAQLSPVSDWNTWLGAISQTAPDAARTNGAVQQSDVEWLHDYLRKFNTAMAQTYTNH